MKTILDFFVKSNRTNLNGSWWKSMNKVNQIEKAYYDVVNDNINMTVPWYLMASYAYYEQDNPILSDAVFDRLAKKILDNWDEIEHKHKSYITKDQLRAGTYMGEYPKQVEGAIESIRGACNGK